MSIQLITLGNLGVLEFTADLVKKAKDVEGHLCEAGVAYGGQLCNMHLADTTKKVYAFDSFEGISQHTDEDEEFTQHLGKGNGNQRQSNGVTSVPLTICRENIIKYVGTLDPFVFIEGWFIDTLPKLTDEKFSVIRLDCDVYEAYKDCLKYLYPRLSKGGYLIIDDFHLSGCKRALIEYFGGEIFDKFVFDAKLGNAYLFNE